MNREKLITRLLSLRETRLREEVAELKARNAALRQIERTRGDARDAAAVTIMSAADLRDLGLIGEVRAGSIKEANAAATIVREASDRVVSANQRARAMRSAKTAVIRARDGQHERAQEHDADQFQSWKRGNDPQR